MTEFLDLDDLIAAANAAVGGAAQIRDVGLLQAAVARPQATAFGDPAYRTLDEQAAALLHSIVTSHPLVDGNKRLGWIAVRLFYGLNDISVLADVESTFRLVVDVADGTLRDVGAIAARLRALRE